MPKPISHRDVQRLDEHRRDGGLTGTQQPSGAVLQAPASAPRSCPRWCVTRHAADLGEEDWVHTGEPLVLADGFSARLCMSIHPTTGEEDGPYVLIGTSELTLDEAARLGASLLDLADAG